MPKYSKEIEIKTGLFQNQVKVIFDNEILTFISENGEELIKKDKMKGFRFGVRWIRGFEFVIGRIYCLDIRLNNSIKKIRLYSLYGKNKDKFWGKHQELLNLLYDYYFDEMIQKMFERVYNNEVIKVNKLSISKEGVTLKNGSFVEWENLNTKLYIEYYMLYPKGNPNNYHSFDFLKDWDTGIVYGLTRGILIEKGYWKEPPLENTTS